MCRSTRGAAGYVRQHRASRLRIVRWRELLFFRSCVMRLPLAKSQLMTLMRGSMPTSGNSRSRRILTLHLPAPASCPKKVSVPAWYPHLLPDHTPPTREVTIMRKKRHNCICISVKDLPWLVDYVWSEVLSNGVHSMPRRIWWRKTGAWYAQARTPEGEIARKTIRVPKRKPDGTFIDDEEYVGKRLRARTEIENWASAVSTGRAPEGSGSPTEP